MGLTRANVYYCELLAYGQVIATHAAIILGLRRRIPDAGEGVYVLSGAEGCNEELAVAPCLVARLSGRGRCLRLIGNLNEPVSSGSQQPRAWGLRFIDSI